MVGMLPVTQTIYKIVILWGGLVLAEPTIGLAADRSRDLGEQIRKHQDRRTATQGKIEQSQKAVRALEAREKPIDRELEALTQTLNTLYGQENQTRSQLTAIRKRLNAAKRRQASLEKEIRTLERNAAQRLVAFYKLNRLGVVPVVLSCNSLSELLHKQKALEAISQHDSALWSTLREKKRALESVRRQTAREEGTKADLLAQLCQEKEKIAKHKADQTRLLAAIRSDKKRLIDHLTTLKASAEKLEKTIRELKALRDKDQQAGEGSGGAFLAAKGVLPPPVDGEVVEPFGSYEIDGHYGTKGFRSGIHFQVDPGTPVRAVYDGEVIYANRLRGYGNMVIIDHGDHFYTLCAQLADFFVQKSDGISAGKVIGIAGGVSTHSGSGVYFEIRHHGKPLDPAPWLLKRQ